jgi:hypothetical protein
MVLDLRGHHVWIRADMRIKIFVSLALSAALVLASGCVGTQTGHETFGVAAKDTITDRYEKPVPLLANAAREVLKRNGTVLVDNVVDNTFEAKVNQRKVYVKVVAMDPKVTAVYVQVRGPFGGDIYLASELSKQIALQLTVTPSP